MDFQFTHTFLHYSFCFSWKCKSNRRNSGVLRTMRWTKEKERENGKNLNSSFLPLSLSPSPLTPWVETIFVRSSFSPSSSSSSSRIAAPRHDPPPGRGTLPPLIALNDDDERRIVNCLCFHTTPLSPLFLSFRSRVFSRSSRSNF